MLLGQLHRPFLPKLTFYCDLDGAVFLSHVIACSAPVDTCAVHGEIPQGHNLWVLQIWGEQEKQCNINYIGETTEMSIMTEGRT